MSASTPIEAKVASNDEVNRPVRRRQRRLMDPASENCHLVAQHDDLDGARTVTATNEANGLEDATGRPAGE